MLEKDDEFRNSLKYEEYINKQEIKSKYTILVSVLNSGSLSE